MQTPRPSATRGMLERALSHVSRQHPRERNRLFNQALSARISIERFDRLLRHFFSLSSPRLLPSSASSALISSACDQR